MTKNNDSNNGKEHKTEMFTQQHPSQPQNEEADPDERILRNQKSMPLVRYLSSHHSDEWDSYTDDDESFIQNFPKIEFIVV